jgi:two-component system nitrate/nitrite response regulator NarL
MLQVPRDALSHDETTICGDLAADDSIQLRPRTVIVSDTHLYRDALTLGLDQSGAVEIVGSSHGEGILDHLASLHPAVMVIDSALADGVLLTRTARSLVQGIKVVVCALTGKDEDFLSWAEAGISGYLGPHSSMSDLIATIHLAVRGEVVCSPRLTGLLLNRYARLSAERPIESTVHTLTPREREVLALVAEGLANKVIARRLRVTEATVKNHVHAILEKLAVGNRGAAAAVFRRELAYDPVLDRTYRPNTAPAAYAEQAPVETAACSPAEYHAGQSGPSLAG